MAEGWGEGERDGDREADGLSLGEKVREREREREGEGMPLRVELVVPVGEKVVDGIRVAVQAREGLAEPEAVAVEVGGRVCDRVGDGEAVTERLRVCG